jgi:hypothetical protein
MKFMNCFLLGGLLFFSTQTTKSEEIFVTDADIKNHTKWTADNVYMLSGFVYVESGETLTIEAGTVIKGMPGQGDGASALIVAQGGKIYANGTRNNPIIFTALSDDLADSADLGPSDKGLWGGLIVLGKARLNSPSAVEQNGFIVDNIEGIPVTDIRGEFGGNDDNDNSGVVRYVSIRHGGSVIGADNEINGLTLGGVGRGTTVEYVEVFANKDDGIEFFGGTVNTSNMVSAFCGDDAFDWDQGYRGNNKYWFVIQDESGDNALELDGDVDDFTKMPLTQGSVQFSTFIGANSNRCIRARENTGLHFYNNIVTDYKNGIKVDSNAEGRLLDGGIEFKNSIFSNVTTLSNDVAEWIFEDTELNLTVSDVGVVSVSRTQSSSLDPRSLSDNGYGAFEPNKPLWTNGWSFLYNGGFTVKEVTNVEVVDYTPTIQQGWSIVGVPYNKNYTVSELFGNTPITVYYWDGSSFSINTFDIDFEEWDEPNQQLKAGAGVWILND